MAPATSPRVAAAFSGERDAALALRLASSAIEDSVEFVLRRVFNDRGEVELVIIEAGCERQDVCDRVMTVMTGAHGVPIPVEFAAGAA